MAQVHVLTQVSGKAHSRRVAEATEEIIARKIQRASGGAAALFDDANTTTITIGGGAAQTTMTLGKAGQTATFLGSVTIDENLTVSGTTTTLSTTNLVVADKLILLSSGAATGDESGVAIERGSTGDDALLLWNEANTRFELGTFDTTAGATAPTGTLTNFSNLKVNDLLLKGTAITAEAGLTVTATSATLTLAATGANIIQLTTNATSRWNVNGSGHLLANTDNTLDIGATGATRPRTGYFGTSVIIGSTVTIETNKIDAGGALTVESGGNFIEQQDAGGAGGSGTVGFTHATTGSAGATGAAGVSPTASGAGGAMTVTGGVGGAGVATVTAGQTGADAGAGAALTVTPGTGGAAAGRDSADGDFAAGGVGGAMTVTAGTGGASDGTASAGGAGGDAGAGGALTVKAGTGGAGSAGAVDPGQPANGGATTLSGGDGGNGAGTSDNGSGGGLDLRGGAAGTGGSGAAGTSGTVTIGATNTAGINIGTGASGHTITIGNAVSGTVFDLDTNGAITMDSSAAGVSIDCVTASNFTVSGATSDLTLGARGATITLNEADNTSLSGFTATSIVGALNELMNTGGAAVRVNNTYTNNTGGSLAQGTLVRMTTTASNVAKADATADNASANYFGITEAAIANTASGDVITEGVASVAFVAGLTLAVGDEVFMSATAGLATNVAPSTSGNVVLSLGFVKVASTYTGTAGDLASTQLVRGSKTVV